MYSTRINMLYHSKGSLNLKLNDHVLDQVFSTKILGVHFDTLLKFDTHIDKLVNKLCFLRYLFSKVKYFLSTNVLLTLYRALVIPHFDYCSSVWSFTYETHKKKIEISQNSFLKILLKNNFTFSATENRKI